MFRMVLCEDMVSCREFLKNSIIKICYEMSETVEILEFSSGEELLANYPKNVDIFFLDIEMDKLTGMDIARKIREVDTTSEIIFTTGVSSYVHEGYEVRAYRYLIKPIEFDDLKNHLSSCINDIKDKKGNYIILRDKKNNHTIKVDDITYVEVFKKEITVHTINDVYNAKISITAVEEELIKYKFFRCHRSYLVNMKKVDSFKSNIIVVNGEEIPISRYRVDEFKKNLTFVLGEVLC